MLTKGIKSGIIVLHGNHKCGRKAESEVNKMKPLTINVDTSALDEAEEKVSRLLSLLKEVKEIIGSLKVED